MPRDGFHPIHASLFFLESTMVKKQQTTSDGNQAEPPLASSVKDSAQQIWLAGLGAFSRVQEEGSKVFEALTKEGLAIQRKTQEAAGEKMAEASSKMTHMASDIQSRAGQQWDKLENIFEDRVAKALNKLGVPSARDIEALTARIDELNKSIQKMSSKAPAGKTAARRTAPNPKPSQKATAKKAPRPAAKRPAAREAE
jgi:poly(hydroxyalkanoate) granule-associated protein